MKVSLSWLRQYVPIEMPVETLAEALTMAGLEVEALSDRYTYLQSVVVGRVVKVSAHPNADNLKCCQVDIGNQRYPVVCGAPNLREEMLSALALVHTELPGGAVVKQTMIRGELSDGMLCSEFELALGPDRSGIMDLSQNPTVGQSIAEALNLSDAVLEIGLTPNRPDCLSMIGVAREVAAIQKCSVKMPGVMLKETKTPIDELTSVQLDAPNLCPRYSARLLDNVTVGPSPFWLQDRLLSVGLRPINNLVDITNFVMLETGQPLHAFDFDRLGGHRIVVRKAEVDEPFTTLDNKERHLSKDVCMICDAERPVAIGGVMGGLESEITPTTRRVLLESATFNPISIRKTSKALGLKTEASHRFERGVDPEGTLYALDRAAQLMVELAGGRLFSGCIDQRDGHPSATVIELSVDAANRLLGTHLDAASMAERLRAIAFETTIVDDENLLVQVPSFRVDVSRPEDLMEEVARLVGYDKIPTTFPTVLADAAAGDHLTDQRCRIRQILVGFGFSEAINYSFIHQDSCDRLNLDQDDERRRQVHILNPLSEDQAVLRTTLVSGLLETAGRNISRQVRNLKLFELGRIFLANDKDDLPTEKDMLCGVWTGLRQPLSWHSRELPCDFYDIKGVVEGLFTALRIEKAQFTSLATEKCRYTNPGFSAEVKIDGSPVGLVGELHPQVLERYNLKQAVFLFELDLTEVLDRIPTYLQAQSIPVFPATARDITLIVDQTIEAARILEQVRGLDVALVEDLYLFDVFQGNPIPRGKKSISFRITYRSSQTTLVDEEINALHKQITETLIEAYDASLPA
jgi:phenylalanyl-tRNA synthetase beta chain